MASAQSVETYFKPTYTILSLGLDPGSRNCGMALVGRDFYEPLQSFGLPKVYWLNSYDLIEGKCNLNDLPPLVARAAADILNDNLDTIVTAMWGEEPEYAVSWADAYIEQQFYPREQLIEGVLTGVVVGMCHTDVQVVSANTIKAFFRTKGDGHANNKLLAKDYMAKFLEKNPLPKEHQLDHLSNLTDNSADAAMLAMYGLEKYEESLLISQGYLSKRKRSV